MLPLGLIRRRIAHEELNDVKSVGQRDRSDFFCLIRLDIKLVNRFVEIVTNEQVSSIPLDAAGWGFDGLLDA